MSGILETHRILRMAQRDNTPFSNRRDSCVQLSTEWNGHVRRSSLFPKCNPHRTTPKWLYEASDVVRLPQKKIARVSGRDGRVAAPFKVEKAALPFFNLPAPSERDFLSAVGASFRLHVERFVYIPSLSSMKNF